MNFVLRELESNIEFDSMSSFFLKKKIRTKKIYKNRQQFHQTSRLYNHNQTF